MFADLVTELTDMATAAAPIGAAILGLIAIVIGISWVKRVGSKAG